MCCSSSRFSEAQDRRPQLDVTESISHKDRRVTTATFLSSVLAIFTVEFPFIVRIKDRSQLRCKFRI